MHGKLAKLLAASAAILLLALPSARASTILDMTTASSTHTQTGALGGSFTITNSDNQSTGTGVIQSFVRINPGGGQDAEQGFNTDARPLQFDENTSSSFTRSLSLSAVPIVILGGTAYREFLLDINQTKADPLLSLNQIQIFLGNEGNLLSNSLTASTGTTPPQVGFSAADATPVFRMNNSNNSNFYQIQLDYSLNSGSGSGDMFLYVQDSVFTGPNTFVYLYSQFGAPPGVNNSNDGFEEWAVRTSAEPPQFTPEPATFAAALSGLIPLGLIGARRLRRRPEISAA